MDDNSLKLYRGAVDINSLNIYICQYEKRHTDEVGDIDVCIVHGENSKWSFAYGPHRPCLAIDPHRQQRTPWEPGRWWRVVRRSDNQIWCETSDPIEARAAMRPGDDLYRIYNQSGERWEKVE